MENRIPFSTLLYVLVGSFALIRVSAADDLNPRERSAAKLFEAWCLEQDLDLKAIDLKATEAHYEVAMDRRIPLGNGQDFKQKNWVVPSSVGAPFLLSTNDVTNGPLRVLGCAIYGSELSGPVTEAELSKLQRMGTPTKHPPPLPQGGRTVWWIARVGSRSASEDSAVMMSKEVPSMPGVSINLIYKLHTDNKGQGK